MAQSRSASSPTETRSACFLSPTRRHRHKEREMSSGSDNQADTGMLSRTGARKSPLATVIDLYTNDLAFRGMTDFAAIGAVVMMFLSPPASVTWPWSSSTGGGGGASGGG